MTITLFVTWRTPLRFYHGRHRPFGSLVSKCFKLKWAWFVNHVSTWRWHTFLKMLRPTEFKQGSRRLIKSEYGVTPCADLNTDGPVWKDTILSCYIWCCDRVNTKIKANRMPEGSKDSIKFFIFNSGKLDGLQIRIATQKNPIYVASHTIVT